MMPDKMTAGSNEWRDLFMRASHAVRRNVISASIIAAIYLGCWLEPLVLEPVLGEFDPVFDPVVCESVSMTISETILESGSINRTRSGSFTNSRFFACGT